MTSNTEAAIQCSLEKLGYSELKTEQERVVREFLGSRDVFEALLTGYGESLHYAILPYVYIHMRGPTSESLTNVLVDSPLRSLIFDH